MASAVLSETFYRAGEFVAVCFLDMLAVLALYVKVHGFTLIMNTPFSVFDGSIYPN